MRDRWDGDKNADPIKIAASYFKHPSDCDWHKAIVSDWAANNSEAIRRASQPYKLEEFRKRLKERLDEIKRLIIKLFSAGEGKNGYDQYMADPIRKFIEAIDNALGNELRFRNVNEVRMPYNSGGFKQIIQQFKGTPWLRF